MRSTLDVRYNVRYAAKQPTIRVENEVIGMTSITATAARKNIYQLIAQVNENCSPVSITSGNGKGAVLVGEDDWASIEETLFLMGVPGMTESLAEGRASGIEACMSEKDLEW